MDDILTLEKCIIQYLTHCFSYATSWILACFYFINVKPLSSSYNNINFLRSDMILCANVFYTVLLTELIKKPSHQVVVKMLDFYHFRTTGTRVCFFSYV